MKLVYSLTCQLKQSRVPLMSCRDRGYRIGTEAGWVVPVAAAVPVVVVACPTIVSYRVEQGGDEGAEISYIIDAFLVHCTT